MKYFFIAYFLFLTLFLGFAQKQAAIIQPAEIKSNSPVSFFTLDASQVFSTFRFSYKFNSEDPQNGQPVYSTILSNGVGLGYEYVKTNGLLLGGGVGLRKSGASLVYKKIDYQWELQYLDLKLGVGYQYDKWRLKPFVSLMPYYAYLISGQQFAGTTAYDIKNTNAIKSYDLGSFINAGLRVALSPYFSVYTSYSYNLALKNIETASGQYLYNRGFAIKLGLAFNITNYKKAQEELQKQNTQSQNEDGLTPDHFSYNNKNVPSEQYPQNSKNNNKQLSTQTITSPGTVGWGNNPEKNNPKNLGKTNKSAQTNSSDTNTNIVSNSSGNINENKTGNGTESTSSQKDNGSSKSSNNKAKNSNTLDISSFNSSKSNKEANNTDSKSTKSAENKSNPEESKLSINSSNNNPKAEKVNEASENAEFVKNNNNGKNKDKNTISSTPKNDAKKTKNSSQKEEENDSEIVFRIQLTAVRNGLSPNHPIFKDKSFKGNIHTEKGKDGWIKYSIGAYDSYEEAHAELNRLKTIGISEGGFVVAFKNGKKITVREAKDLLH